MDGDLTKYIIFIKDSDFYCDHDKREIREKRKGSQASII